MEVSLHFLALTSTLNQIDLETLRTILPSNHVNIAIVPKIRLWNYGTIFYCRSADLPMCWMVFHLPEVHGAQLQSPVLLEPPGTSSLKCRNIVGALSKHDAGDRKQVLRGLECDCPCRGSSAASRPTKQR
jgi:hypothetical protein